MAGEEEEVVMIKVNHFQVTFQPHFAKGAFGTLHRAIDTNNNTELAGKRITKSMDKEADQMLVEEVRNELEMIRKLHTHRNIVQFIEFVEQSSAFWIFMELCDVGDLKYYLKSKRMLSEREIWTLFHQSAQALDFMHSQSPPIIHRDIKLQNILLKRENGEIVLKIGDFGFARVYDEQFFEKFSVAFKPGQRFESLRGSPPFMAPEFSAELEGGLSYDETVDVFSLGLVYLVILDPNPPDFVPLSENSKRMNHEVNIGLEMVCCHRENKPLPTVVATNDCDSRCTKRFKRIIRHMTRFRAKDRKSIREVAEELAEMEEDFPIEETVTEGAEGFTEMKEDSPKKETVAEGAVGFTESITPRVESVNLEANNDDSGEMNKMQLSEVVSRIWMRQHSKKQEDVLYALRVAEQQLWSCQHDGISIYDAQLVMQRHIPLRWVHDVALWCEGQVIVATEEGLYHMAITGERLDTISSIIYTGVSVRERRVYAAGYHGPIDMYELRDTWKRVQKINTPKDHVTLHVSEHAIAACLCNNNTVHIFSHSGKLLYQCGKDGKGGAGELRYPRLYHGDESGALLISDWGNNRLQVLTSDREWHVLELQPPVKQPQGAVILNGKLYVYSCNDNNIHIYEGLPI